jgi:hypothetical protein
MLVEVSAFAGDTICNIQEYLHRFSVIFEHEIWYGGDSVGIFSTLVGDTLFMNPIVYFDWVWKNSIQIGYSYRN